MIISLLLINIKGEIVIQRIFRDDIVFAAIDAFRTQVCFNLFFSMFLCVKMCFFDLILGYY